MRNLEISCSLNSCFLIDNFLFLLDKSLPVQEQHIETVDETVDNRVFCKMLKRSNFITVIILLNSVVLVPSLEFLINFIQYLAKLNSHPFVRISLLMKDCKDLTKIECVHL